MVNQCRHLPFPLEHNARQAVETAIIATSFIKLKPENQFPFGRRDICQFKVNIFYCSAGYHYAFVGYGSKFSERLFADTVTAQEITVSGFGRLLRSQIYKTNYTKQLYCIEISQNASKFHFFVNFDYIRRLIDSTS